MAWDKQRAAKYQARQRRAVAEAKAEKERQRQAERAGMAPGTLQIQGNGWATGPITIPPGSWIINNTIHVNTSPAPVKLPSEQATELIVGYRIWPLRRSFPEGYRLTAVNSHFDGIVTPSQRREAECKKHVYESGNWLGTLYGSLPEGVPKTHAAPDANCTCGIYAYRKSVPLEPSDKPYVAGEVYLWGRVIQHEDGYRAQYAYPKRLYVVDGGAQAEAIATALAVAYGVPCEVWAG